MNTHRLTFTARNGVARLALSMLGGLLLALSLLFAPAAFAAPARLDGQATPSLSQEHLLDLAGVSVVRLELTYATKKTTPVTCTALGSLIASWPTSSGTDQNNWIVTDSSLLALQNSACPSSTSLLRIQIWANNLYTNNHPVVLDTINCANGKCLDQQSSVAPLIVTASSSSVDQGALLSFHTDELDVQPFLDLSTTALTIASDTGIELVNPAQSVSWPATPALQATQVTSFLTPRAQMLPASSATSGSASSPTATTLPSQKFEAGMPFVTSQGQFAAMQLAGSSALFTAADLSTLEKQPAFQTPFSAEHGPNLLKQQWDLGVMDLDQQRFAQADRDFKAIQNPNQVLNPQFQAANVLDQQALLGLTPTASNSSGGTSNAKGTGGSSTILGISSTVLLWIGLVAGVILLVLLLVLATMFVGRRRRKDREELDRFKQEAAAARRNAPQEAQRIAEESQQRQHQPLNGGAPQPYAQAAPPAPPAPPSLPAQSVPTASSAPAAPAVGPQSAQPEPEYAYSDAMDAPTVPMGRKNGFGDAGSQATEAPVVREFHNVSMAVGSRSDVGLKRQHKPNEDSLFAIQAARTHNSQTEQYGFFVIADGMGGHANGGDASRTAIQTMIDFMLPKISIVDPNMSDQSYLKLLEEGVQRSNYAVHQRNLQDHADMGTTMTTALVIGSMAYVANVGDSRTYLYRPATGLAKVTRDHSVVASLVDAGIIKPDDIYTHPKRNQIYRSLGEKPNVEVDTFPVELQAGDKLLLCSDGLWDLVRDPDIQRIVAATEANPKQTTDDLIQAALNGGGDDNVSVIVVSITEIDGHTGMTGIHFLSKPESITMPDVPAV